MMNRCAKDRARSSWCLHGEGILNFDTTLPHCDAVGRRRPLHQNCASTDTESFLDPLPEKELTAWEGR